MMQRTRRWKLVVGMVMLLGVLILPALALAGPRSGGSFGGRSGFRSTSPSGGYSRSTPSGRGYGTGYGSGPSFFFFPGFGYGGCGGGGMVGGLVLVVILGMAALTISRVVRRMKAGTGASPWNGEDEDASQAFVARAQIALGRSARDIQERLARFAAEGDTSSQSGLAALLQQTSLELLRERDSFRYVHVEADGPLSLPSAESKMNGMALQERSHFQVERVRSADGALRRASEAAEEGKEALEYVLVTLIAATTVPMLEMGKKRPNRAPMDETVALLSTLGGITPETLLGVEVIWTPADPQDSLTETDLLTTYPELRSA